ncbi:hypothetical protein HVA01_07680 [Halovibrio variabilis]|uniref:Uncharacterized protein n=1 Tax=Halovibrio variabilis TaxID=31910 RepID=A0A511UPQ4_9GAMM|nr:hypothetical protein [Halovibrio variabilis]GEN27122.1 hypothetical protein HVA01_07680 [Halovibrio variabilis]
MTTAESPTKAWNAPHYDIASIWWHQPWVATSSSTIKIQHILFEACNDTMRLELEFFAAMAASYSKLTSCMLGLQGLQTPSSLASCYQNAADEMGDAAIKRMQKVSELTEDVEELIWSEI